MKHLTTARLPRVCMIVLLGCSGTPSGAPSPQPAASARTPATTSQNANANTPGSAGGSASVATAEPVTAKVGDAAPAFELPDLDGKTVRLADFSGKVVVLEWFNPECPFVNYAHDKGPLNDMAKRFGEKGVVWLAINSAAAGKQGHGIDVNKKGAAKFGVDHPILLDESGKIGRTYGAEKTPHMFVIDPKGVLVYKGGLDNAPHGEPDGGTLEPLLANAVDAVLAGRPVGKAEARAYGCTVKYGAA